jgi:hypothetical protein
LLLFFLTTLQDWLHHTIGEAIVNKVCAFMFLLRRLMHTDWHHPNLKVHAPLVSVTVLHKVLTNLKSQRLSCHIHVPHTKTARKKKLECPPLHMVQKRGKGTHLSPGRDPWGLCVIDTEGGGRCALPCLRLVQLEHPLAPFICSLIKLECGMGAESETRSHGRRGMFTWISVVPRSA